MAAEHGGNRLEIARNHQLDAQSIIDFSANINPLGPSENVIHAIKEKLDQMTVYPDASYHDLKQAIATFHNTQPERIVLGNGAAEIIYSLAKFLPKGKVLTLAPTFSEYEAALNSVDFQHVHHLLPTEDLQPHVANIIEQAQTEHVQSIVICNPNNPTGFYLPRSEMRKLINFCQQQKITLVVDEAFIDFISESESVIAELANLPHDANIFVVRSLTKMFAIPGLRIGYLVCANLAISQYLTANSIPWAINSFAEIAAIASLNDATFVTKTREYVKIERQYLIENLRKIPEIKVYAGHANYLLLNWLPNSDLQAACLKQNILIRSCQNYHGLNQHFYRIAVKDHAANAQLLQVLQQISEQEQH